MQYWIKKTGITQIFQTSTNSSKCDLNTELRIQPFLHMIRPILLLPTRSCRTSIVPGSLCICGGVQSLKAKTSVSVSTIHSSPSSLLSLLFYFSPWVPIISHPIKWHRRFIKILIKLSPPITSSPCFHLVFVHNNQEKLQILATLWWSPLSFFLQKSKPLNIFEKFPKIFCPVLSLSNNPLYQNFSTSIFQKTSLLTLSSDLFFCSLISPFFTSSSPVFLFPFLHSTLSFPFFLLNPPSTAFFLQTSLKAPRLSKHFHLLHLSSQSLLFISESFFSTSSFPFFSFFSFSSTFLGFPFPSRSSTCFPHFPKCS